MGAVVPHRAAAAVAAEARGPEADRDDPHARHWQGRSARRAPPRRRRGRGGSGGLTMEGLTAIVLGLVVVTGIVVVLPILLVIRIFARLDRQDRAVEALRDRIDSLASRMANAG